jgi:hypothetical protein
VRSGVFLTTCVLKCKRHHWCGDWRGGRVSSNATLTQMYMQVDPGDRRAFEALRAAITKEQRTGKKNLLGAAVRKFNAERAEAAKDPGQQPEGTFTSPDGSCSNHQSMYDGTTTDAKPLSVEVRRDLATGALLIGI